MADPAPPAAVQKPAGPMRFILIGCGLMAGLLILGLGSCAGFMYVIYRGTDPIAVIGGDYLIRSPEVRKELGEGLLVKRNPMGWNVSTSNDSGAARIQYTVSGPARPGTYAATVWLAKSAGKWSPTGARLVPADGSSGTIEIGNPPKAHFRIDRND